MRNIIIEDNSLYCVKNANRGSHLELGGVTYYVMCLDRLICNKFKFLDLNYLRKSNLLITLIFLNLNLSLPLYRYSDKGAAILDSI